MGIYMDSRPASGVGVPGELVRSERDGRPASCGASQRNQRCGEGVISEVWGIGADCDWVAASCGRAY